LIGLAGLDWTGLDLTATVIFYYLHWMRGQRRFCRRDAVVKVVT
jgi:hypothetical protein